MKPINIFGTENVDGRIDVARALDSAAMLMFVYNLAPGQSSCPYHYEYDEEWLLVVEGTIVVRTPDGEDTLDSGDLVCFSPGPAGAHKVMNRSESPARTLMSSSTRTRPSPSTRTATRSACGRGTRRTRSSSGAKRPCRGRTERRVGIRLDSRRG